MSDYVVPWSEVIEYFKECREASFVKLSMAETDKAVWRAQGEIALLDELLNLKDVFATMSEVDKLAPATVASEAPKRVWLTRTQYGKGG